MLKNDLERAVALALKAHAGQLDKGGQPYILHPLRVMLAGRNRDEMIVGALHDVVEDAGVPLADIGAVFGLRVKAAVDALSRRAGEDYPTFIGRVARNPLAAAVKRNDLADNMNLDRLPAVGPDDLIRLAKYRAALANLEK